MVVYGAESSCSKRSVGADLTGANLSRADLFNANLTDADLEGATLTKANLTGVTRDLCGWPSRARPGHPRTR